MTRNLWGALRRTRDEGTALVAAIAVAIIGVSLTTVVVTQAITVTNDTAKDRQRTVEVHSAESALDETLSILATSSPCPGPSFSPVTVGEGTDSAVVTVTIEYFAGNTPLSCSSGAPVGTPTRAVVTAVATPGVALPGSQPLRTMEATVNLIPLTQSIPGAAIFASTGISTGAGFRILPEDPNKPAAIWLDSGNFTCNTSVTVDGSLYVVNGSVSMQNSSCTVNGSVWVKTNFTSCCTPSAPLQIKDSLTVRNGTLTVSNPDRIGGSISVGGNITLNQHWTNSTKGGAVCAANLTACTTFTNYAPVGLPEIDLDIADWQPTAYGANFQRKYKADFGEAVIASWGFGSLPSNDWRVTAIRGNPCYIPGYMSSTPIQLPSTTSSSPTLFDMRDCKFEPNNPVTLSIKADIAIFANGFDSSNSLNLVSADGQPHKVWFIVPEGGTANNGVAEKTQRTINVNGTNVNYTPGNINFSSNAITVDGQLDLFIYTPGTLNFPNTAITHGQLYAGSVTVGQGGGMFYYSAIGVPGVNLDISTTGTAGSRVEIVNKREVKQ